MPPKPANLYYPPTTNPTDRAAWDRINYLLREIASLNERVSGLGTGQQAKQIGELQVQIAAVQDALTQAGTFVGAGSSQFTSSSVTVAASGDGITISGPSDGATIDITTPATTRTALGLGGLAVLNAGTAVPDSAVVAGVAYVQANFQSVIDTLNDLLGSLRTAGIIAT